MNQLPTKFDEWPEVDRLSYKLGIAIGALQGLKEQVPNELKTRIDSVLKQIES